MVNSLIFSSPKLLAKNPEQKQNNQISTKIDTKNQERTPLDSWLEIIQQNREQLSQHELALIKSKVASAFFQVGNYQEAIEYWRWANKVYRTNQQNRLLANNLSNLAIAYLSLGETLLAEKKINEAIKIAQEEHVLFSGYLILGKIAKLTGKYLEAETNFNKSLEYARPIEEKIAVNLNLSQVFNAQAERLLKRTQVISAEDLELESIKNQMISYRDKAWLVANRAVELSENVESLITVDALLQAIKLADEYKVDDFNPAPFLAQARTTLSTLPDSNRKVYALINLSKFEQNPLAILMPAEQIAEQIQALRAQSHALGNLGNYYERQKQYQKALEATEKAILVASQAEDYKSSYRWQWQKGRIYTALNVSEKAIPAYNQAIASLRSIKAELAKSTDEQIDFELEIEPVYRELLQLLLADPTPEQIEQALRIRDLLQLSELENFFGDDCLELLSGQENLLPSQTGVIYTIVLPDVTYVIFKQGQVTTTRKIAISQSELEKLIGEWRYSLEDRSEVNYWSLSQQMYGLLLKPIESELSLNKPDTLIFVNDGILRNVPMSTLYDGQKFLVENYALSFSLSLNLRVRDEQNSLPKTLLTFALSEATDNFSALPYVQEEIKSINKFIDVKEFSNIEFVISKVEKELAENNYGIVHFATHAKFNGTLEDSFLKTYDEQISLTDLENMFNLHQLNFPENPLDLLVLSACETAASNKRATLGMAGVAIRSGVRNAVGSLWSISDRASVKIITEFYQGLLSQELPPNEALRQAQIKMIGETNSHPAFWSNLILIDS